MIQNPDDEIGVEPIRVIQAQPGRILALVEIALEPDLPVLPFQRGMGAFGVVARRIQPFDQVADKGLLVRIQLAGADLDRILLGCQQQGLIDAAWREDLDMTPSLIDQGQIVDARTWQGGAKECGLPGRRVPNGHGVFP